MYAVYIFSPEQRARGAFPEPHRGPKFLTSQEKPEEAQLPCFCGWAAWELDQEKEKRNVSQPEPGPATQRSISERPQSAAVKRRDAAITDPVILRGEAERENKEEKRSDLWPPLAQPCTPFAP